MSISRRTVLRNLGALGAAQSLARVSGASMVETPDHDRRDSAPAQALKSFHLLFEGPWFFSLDPLSGLLNVTAVIGKNHACDAGKWNAGFTPKVSPKGGDRWSAKLSSSLSVPTPVFDYKTVVGGAFQSNHAPYLIDNNLSVTPDPTDDVVFSLPVPNEVHFAGHLLNAVVSDGSGNPRRIYITTILKYTQSKPSEVLNMTLSGSGTSLLVNLTQQAIFRLKHTPNSDLGGDPIHVKHAFLELQTRVSTAAQTLALQINAVGFESGPNPDGFPDEELGLGMMAMAPGQGTPVSGPPSQIHVDSDSWSNCAGGGAGGGGCPGC